MAARSIASLSLSFGLVSIPVKLYSATESSAAIHFKLMAGDGSRVRQQYVSERSTAPPAPAVAPPASPAAAAAAPFAPTVRPARPVPPASPALLDPPRASSRVEPIDTPMREPAVVERSQMVKGYEYEKGRFVLFTPDELKALEEGSRQTIDIVSFIPERSVDPIYYDKAYYLAPDKRGSKPYTLLLKAMQKSGQCALAKWAWRSKEYAVQIRPANGGLVLQQLLYAEEVRSLQDLHIELVDVGDSELQLALQLIDQIAEPAYDPSRFVDEERERILAAVEEKIAGHQVVAPEHHEPATSGQVIDLGAALRASLAGKKPVPNTAPPPEPGLTGRSERKPARRAEKTPTVAAPKKRSAAR
jgi:DNA end-binding protein Ku